MSNYNYITTDIIDIIDNISGEVTVKSSRGNTCVLKPLFNSDNEIDYICVNGDSCSYGCSPDNLGRLIFSVLLALKASLKLDYYGYLKCEFSCKPNTIWYFNRENKLVFFDKYGDWHTLCEL